MPLTERAIATRRAVVTAALALVVAGLTALVVVHAGRRVSRVQAALSVSACRLHVSRPGERIRRGEKYVEVDVAVAYLGGKPLPLAFDGLQLAPPEGTETYRLVHMTEVPPSARRASGFTPGVQSQRFEMIFEVPGSFTTGRLLYLGHEISRVNVSE
jgi:hypothetical protein